MVLNKMIINLGGLNKHSTENSVLSINTSSFIGKMTFGLVWNAESSDYSRKTLDREVPKTVISGDM